MIQHSSIPRTPLRRSACAVLLLSAVSAPALAETNVAIYGIIDAGLLYQSKTDPDGKSKTSMETSGLRQSVLGFKGDR
ncbi:porin, partial [Zoogloea sp.]|uniref:porin n=1 Tax=Zoogloea sp. TaxID=49181 RepID=UPI0026013963